MPQSLLALLALMLASLTAFGVQRSQVHAYGGMTDNEVDMMAGALATHTIEVLEEMPFDTRVLPATVAQSGSGGGLPRTAGTSSNGFSQERHFGYTRTERGSNSSGGPCNLVDPVRTPHCNDLDDFHGVTDQAVPFRTRGGEEVPFEVSVRIDNVAGILAPQLGADITSTSTPSLNKQITVTVRSSQLASIDQRYAGDLVTMTRIISYDIKKSDRAFQMIYNRPPRYL